MISLARTVTIWAWALASAAGVDMASETAGAVRHSLRTPAQASLRACQEAVRSDNWLALSNCHHFPDPAAKRACRQAAAADTKSALDRCAEQFKARRGVRPVE